MTETFHINSKNETKWNKFYLILNLGPFRVPVSFHVFRSALEKPLNQSEPCSISLIKPPDYKKLFFITIFINNNIIFLKLDLSLIYMVYIHVFFSCLYLICRNLSKTRDVLDSISHFITLT